jgi:rubrerythrin
MKSLSVKEILAHAQKIEQESYNFYKKAEQILEEKDLKKLAHDLANFELEHYEKLEDLVKQQEPGSKELQRKLELEEKTVNVFVHTQEITPLSSQEEVLDTALDREENTKSFYQVLRKFQDLAADISETLDFLIQQEQEHIEVIKEKRAQL